MTLPPTGFDPNQPFTRQDALRAGLSDRRLAGPAYTCLFHGIYVSALAAADELVRARAALIALPEGAISGRTAARLWGAVVPHSADVEILLARNQRTEMRGIRMHRPARRPPTTTHLGLRMLTPAAVFLRLAAELELVDLVIAGDSLVRTGQVTPAQLVEAADRSSGRGARLARRAARLVRPGVDSPQETRLRLLLVLAGLPEPEVNIILRDSDGGWVYRLDLGYQQHLVAVEYDGRQHAESRAQWTKDIARREALEGRGWRMIVVLGDDLFIHPDRTIARVAAALRARGLRVRVTPQWQRHFSVRRAAA